MKLLRHLLTLLLILTACRESQASSQAVLIRIDSLCALLENTPLAADKVPLLLQLGDQTMRDWSDTLRVENARNYYHQCSTLAKAIRDDRHHALCLMHYANKLADTHSRLFLLHESLTLYTALGDSLGMREVLRSIASAYKNGGDIANASKTLQTAIEYKKGIVDREYMLLCEHIGMDLFGCNQADEAIPWLLKALDVSIILDDFGYQTELLSHLARANIKINKSSEVLRYSKAIIETHERYSSRLDSVDRAFSLLNVAQANEWIAEELYKKSKYREALTYAEKTIPIYNDIKWVLRSNGNHLRILYLLYEAIGEYKTALSFHKEYSEYDLRKTQSELTVKHKINEKEYEHKRRANIDSLHRVSLLKDIEHQRQVTELTRNEAQTRLVTSLLSVMIGTFAVFVYSRWRAQRKRAIESLRAARLEAQVLRTQMNPHFIFNALNSINNYVQANESDLASGFLTKFARLMRLVLENSRHDEVPLSQDLETLQLYMDLERSRMQEKFDYTITVDPSIDQTSTLVPPLVAQPFVENAIWHGISRKEGKGHIQVVVMKSGDTLLLSIEDDGVGRTTMGPASPPDAPPKTSLGTTITRERLAMLSLRQGKDAGFDYVDLSGGTRVVVSMPFHSDE